jgi:putative serine/threonine protein kinase
MSIIITGLRFQDFVKEVKDLREIGRGWRGVVYRGLWRGKEVALKVASRPEAEEAIRKEAKILKALRGRGGYPQLLASGDDFLVYEFIRGKTLREANLDPEERRRVYRILLERAFELDNLGINRDEFAYVDKNVILGEDGEVYVIDFDRGNFKRRPSNLTQFLQLLVREGFLGREEAIELGRRYKKDREGVFREVYRKLK